MAFLFQIENERIVAQKDKELESVRQKLKEESSQIQEKKVHELTDKITFLQKQLESVNEEKVNCLGFRRQVKIVFVFTDKLN